jgi:tripartite-type tricarboxylate transporter receptor subunit TctC
MMDYRSSDESAKKATRRDFLKVAAGFTAGAAFSAYGQPLATAATPAPTKVNFPGGKPITVIAAATPGGGTDVMARTMAPFIEKELNTRCVIINKGAGGGQEGITEVYTAPADGYTVGVISSPQHVQQAMDPERKTPYKMADFTFLACSVSDPGVLVVRSDAPFKTAKEFIDHALKNKGKVNVGDTGKGGDDHLHMLSITELTGADFNYIHFNGTAPGKTALLGGHTDAWACNESEGLPMVTAKQGRILWIANRQRSKFLPDVPTLKEVTGTEIVTYSQRGWCCSAKVPKEIKEAWNAALKKVHNDPEVIKKFASLSYPIVYYDIDQWSPVVCTEMERIARLVKKFGVFDPISQPCPKG